MICTWIHRKIIGARYYPTKTKDNSVSDSFSSHGTNIASIAAGKKVGGVDFFGLAKGNVRGGFPLLELLHTRSAIRIHGFVLKT